MPPMGTIGCITALVGLLLLASCPAHAAQLGDWKDLSRNLSFLVFSKGRPFNPTRNLAFCKRHTIKINFSSSVKDYTKTFNTALENLRARNPPGGTLKLGAGRFPIGGQIEIGSFTCLFGAGRLRTTIRVKGNSKPFRTSGAVRSMHTQRVTVSDLTIDGNRKAQRTLTKRDRYGRYGFFSELTNYLYLRRVGVVNNLGYGFDPHGSKLHWSYYLLLENCYARNNGLDGFTLDQTLYVGVLNSRGEKNGRHGMNVVTGTRYLVASGNVLKNNGFESAVGCGMMVQNNQQYGTRGIKLVTNTVVNSRKAGMCLNDVRDVQVVRNRFSNSFPKAVCYYLDAVRKVRFKDNTCAITRAGVFRKIGINEYAVVRMGVGITKVSKRTRK